MFPDFVPVLQDARSRGFDLAAVKGWVMRSQECYHASTLKCDRVNESASEVELSLEDAFNESSQLCRQCFSGAQFGRMRFSTWVSKFSEIMKAADNLKRDPGTFEEFADLVDTNSWKGRFSQSPLLLEWAEKLGAFMPFERKVQLARDLFLPVIHRKMIEGLFLAPKTFNRKGMETVSDAYRQFVAAQVEPLLQVEGWSLIDSSSKAETTAVPRYLAWSVYSISEDLAVIPNLLLPCYPNAKVISVDGPIPSDVAEALVTFYDRRSTGPFRDLSVAFEAARTI